MTVKQRMEDRRNFLTAWTILSGNSGFDGKEGWVMSADGRAYTVRNAQYATALADAVVEGRDVGIMREEALRRIATMLHRLLAQRSDGNNPALLYRYVGADAAPLTPGTGAAEMLGVLAYLDQNLAGLNVVPDLAPAIRLALDRLFEVHVRRMEKILERTPSRMARRPGKTSAREWVSGVERTIGKRLHWTDLKLFDVATFLPDPFPWPIPVHPCSLTECHETSCFVDGIPTNFFKGTRKGLPGLGLPVILTGGWQVQFQAHPGGPGFGDEGSFETHEPAQAPWGNNTDQLLPPPVWYLNLAFHATADR